MNEQPLRVLHVIGHMDVGGAETMIMNLYRHIDRDRVQFDFVEGTDNESFFDKEIRSLGGRVFNCPAFRGINKREYVKWWENFLDEHQGEFGIIHGHIGSTASIYLSSAREREIFTIAHSHNTKGNLNFKNLMYRILSYRTRFIANEFFACSIAAGKDRFGESIVTSDRFYILKNAIETDRFSFDEKRRKIIRGKLAVGDKLVIGHVGAFRREKNHEFLLEIFAELRKKTDRTILILAGDGVLRRQAEQQAEKLGIADDVLFLGVRNDVDELFQAMDILVMPSLYEGLPLTLVEAQTSGLPCLLSDKIPSESIITGDIIKVLSLNDKPETWVDYILQMSEYNRRDRRKEIVDAEYDIEMTSKWLENYYLENAKG